MPRYTPVHITSFDELNRELQRIQNSLDTLYNGEFEIVSTAPSKPVEGMQIYADGTGWNPGSGKGFYEYDGSSWSKL